METQFKRYSILVADDDEGDRFLINKAMKANGVENQIQFLEDGQKLVDHLTENLKSTHPGDKPSLPCLILLDLNMPLLDGWEALKIVKNHAQLREIPVVILTNSDNPEDVTSSYLEGANSFFTKPLDYLDLVRLMGLLKNYWFQNAKLPFERPKFAE
ncbi:MAG TPA: response regulator [bacterium]|jgi:two-component system response regulator|nr:response regulator [bacterium]